MSIETLDPATVYMNDRKIASREFVAQVRDWMEQANGDAEVMADLIVQNQK